MAATTSGYYPTPTTTADLLILPRINVGPALLIHHHTTKSRFLRIQAIAPSPSNSFICRCNRTTKSDVHVFSVTPPNKSDVDYLGQSTKGDLNINFETKQDNIDTANAKQQKHYILVHGGCHGAWCWYKLNPLLEAAGHRVTAIDLSASGINTKSVHEIHTLEDYAEPLMEFIEAVPADEKVILVGHSFGGWSLALAMEHYPQKISVAVFVAALMPDAIHPPFYVQEERNKKFPERDWVDTQFLSYGSPDDPKTAITLGSKYMSTMSYIHCPTEDLELAKLLVRPCTLLEKDLSKRKKFSAQGYGSVSRTYIICAQDKAVEVDFQRWLVKTIGVAEVKEIEDADHMVMLSRPQKLCQYLIEIADRYI